MRLFKGIQVDKHAAVYTNPNKDVAWIIYGYELAKQQLVLLRLVCLAEDAVSVLVDLLTASLQLVMDCKLKEFFIWNPTEALLAAARLLNPEVLVVERESTGINSISFHGNGEFVGEKMKRRRGANLAFIIVE